MQVSQSKRGSDLLIFSLIVLNTLLLRWGFVDHPDYYSILFFTLPLMVVLLYISRNGSGNAKKTKYKNYG